MPVPVEAPEQVVEAVWVHVTERTRVLACSHLTSPTALIPRVGPSSPGDAADDTGGRDVAEARDAGREMARGGGLVLGRAASRLVAEHEWQGTRGIAAWLSVPKAIRFVQTHLGPEVRDRCHALARRARAEITALTGLPPLSPDDAAWYTQMVSVPLPVADPEAAQHRRRAEGIEVPVFRWTDRCLLRISVHAYNEPADIERLVAAVRRLLG